MGRLIDVDTINGTFAPSETYTGREVMALLNQQPTAYNVDEVVEQLEEARDELLHSTDYNNDIINYCLDWFDMAIEIVKGAVKDEYILSNYHNSISLNTNN